jgi:hypothetical protein
LHINLSLKKLRDNFAEDRESQGTEEGAMPGLVWGIKKKVVFALNILAAFLLSQVYSRTVETFLKLLLLLQGGAKNITN